MIIEGCKGNMVGTVNQQKLYQELLWHGVTDDTVIKLKKQGHFMKSLSTV